MCKREPGEPLWSFMWRQLCEKPQMVLAFVGLVAAGFLYHDLRELMQSQTETNLQIAQELRELNIRVSNLENKYKQ